MPLVDAVTCSPPVDGTVEDTGTLTNNGNGVRRLALDTSKHMGEHEKTGRSRGGLLFMLAARGCPKAQVPLAKQPLQLVIQNLRTHLDQKVGTLLRPLHLLLLYHPFTDYLVHRGFDECCRDPLLIAIPFPEVRNEGSM